MKMVRFWIQHPALLYGIFAYSGFYLGLQGHASVLLPLIPLILCLYYRHPRLNQHILFSILLAIVAMLYAKTCYNLPSIPEEGTAGKAHFTITSVSHSQTLFGHQWLFQGKIASFAPNDTSHTIGKNFPATIRLPSRKTLKRPPADRAYLIEGILKKSPNGTYYLQVDKNKPWLPIKGTSSLAEWRFNLKKKVKGEVYKHIPDGLSAEFLSGIVTGEFEDRVMRAEFGRLGLQHIMAISGFHFAIIASFLGLVLRWILSQKWSTGLLIFLLCSYFLCLGASPSIFRAWLMSFIALFGLLAEQKNASLNALGIAILAILLLDPMMTFTLGFQFSAATTAAILLWFPIMSQLLEKFFVKRSLSHVSQMSVTDQHCYCLVGATREALALAVAVNLVAIPMTLFYFQKFPTLSLIYNLFIPLMVSISICLFLIGTAIFLVFPIIGSWIHTLNSHFTRQMLDSIYNVPISLNPIWRVEPFSGFWLTLFLCIFFTLGIFLQRNGREPCFSTKFCL